MKKLTGFFMFIAGTFLLNAQDLKGIATYESKLSTEDTKFDSPQMSEDMKKMIEAQMKKMSEKTFTLTFDKTASLYEEEIVLEAGSDNPMNQGFRMMSNTMYGGVHYKNIKDSIFMQERDIFGKEFLIKDSLKIYNWQLGTETKKIGNYMCFKATAVVPFDMSDFKNMRRKSQEEIKEKEKEGSTNFLDMVEIPKEITVTAWYTPQIPVSQGPGEYWGLPGLIMEVSAGKTTILCSKLVINPKEKKEIKAPKKGKVVTQKEYQDIMMEKMEEFQKMGRGRGGNVRMGRF